MMDANPDMKIAVIDKDEPGGICLTKGCIPSKILLYPAELVRDIQRSDKFGIDVEIKSIDFKKIMGRMRKKILESINLIRDDLSHNLRIRYYRDVAEFISPYTLKVGDETITSKMIFLSTGSKPMIPPVKGLENVGYLTSDTVLELDDLPKSIVIIGGGYIAAEYGNFFSAMGSRVTIVGRNPQFIPEEEPEVSFLAKRMMSEYLTLLTNYEALEVLSENGNKIVIARDRASGEEIKIITHEILVAAGRSPNTDILKPEKAGIEIDKRGWIKVNDHLETSQRNIWAFGDAIGKYLFKHMANYESMVVYSNVALELEKTVDYHAVPYAVFSDPEIAGVGMGERKAIEIYGEDNILIGFYRFLDTGKGMAMDLESEFVKVILEKESRKILGAHIIGPHASILIHEIIPLMYTKDQSAFSLMYAIDIHPSLSEVVKRAFYSTMSVEEYHVMLKTLGLEN